MNIPEKNKSHWIELTMCYFKMSMYLLPEINRYLKNFVANSSAGA